MNTLKKLALILVISIVSGHVQLDAALTGDDYKNVIGRGLASGLKHNLVQQTMEDIKAKGFDNIRIRCEADEYYNNEHLDYLLEVVDRALNAGLVPILSWGNKDAEENASNSDKQNYINWWSDVAVKLQGRSDLISFNLFTELSSGSPIRENISIYEAWTQGAVDAIRAVSPTRMIILAAPTKTSKKLLEIPSTIYENDDYMMAEWHLYASGPNHGGGQKNWEGGGSASDRENVTKVVDKALEFTNLTGIHTYVGAWIPISNQTGEVTNDEAESFGTFFLEQLSAAEIPWSANSVGNYYDDEAHYWYLNTFRGPNETEYDLQSIVNILTTVGNFKWDDPGLTPIAPTSLTANATSCSSVNLNWSDNSDNEDSFQIKQSTNGGGYSIIASVSANSTAYTVSGLSENTSYSYKVKAMNSYGSSSVATSNNVTTQSCPVNSYNLNVNTNGNGSVNTPGGIYEEGTVVTLTATADAGWTFDNWSGDASGTANSINITIDANKSVTANFTEVQVPVYTLTTSVIGSGSISPSGGTYNEGTVVTLTATPVAGYVFDGWSGDASGTSASTSVTMNSNKSVTATFVEEPTGPITSTVTASGDAYVRNGSYSGTNYGSSAELQVKTTSNANAKRFSYIQFDLSNIGAVTSAQLKVKSIGNENTDIKVYSTSDGWDESSILWSNKPALGNLEATFNIGANGNYTVDVTSYIAAQVNGDNTASFALKCATSRLMTLSSKEGSYAPRLIVEHDGSPSAAIREVTRNVEMYPNPTNGIVRININDNEFNNASVKVVNSYGSIIETNTIYTNAFDIDLHNYAGGLYFVVVSYNGTSITKQILKQ